MVLQRGLDALDVALPEGVDELGHDLRGDLVGLTGADLPGRVVVPVVAGQVDPQLALHLQEHRAAGPTGGRVDVQALAAHPAGGVGALQDPPGIGQGCGDLRRWPTAAPCGPIGR